MTWNNLLVVLGVLLLLGIIAYLIFRRREYGKRIHRLPLHLLGYPNIPAVPFVLTEIPDTLLRLGKRAYATTQAKSGLNNTYKIGDYEANGYSFLPLAGNKTELIFGNDPNEPRNAALITFREYIHNFIAAYDAPTPQYYQWPRNIET